MRSMYILLNEFGFIKGTMRMKIAIAAMVCAVCLSCGASVSQENAFEKMGRETLDVIHRDHAIRGVRGGYYEDHNRKAIAFTWSKSMLLLAYARAAQMDSAVYAEPLDLLVKQLDRYWIERNGIGGYDHLPHPRGDFERYYDDNAWVAMGLIDAWDAVKKDDYLERAKKTIEFSLSGINQKQGGIWWREDPQETMNTCSVAPTAFACLRYFEVTGQRAYLETAKALMVWLDANLQDTDHLYWDSIRPAGRVNRRKWSYNTGMPLQNYVKLSRLTGEKSYLEKAIKIAEAAEKQWINPDTGAVTCESMFAWTLAEGWVELSAAADQPRWRSLSERATSYLYRSEERRVG